MFDTRKNASLAVLLLATLAAWPVAAADESQASPEKPAVDIKAPGGSAAAKATDGSAAELVVPDGTTTELAAFINKLISGQPPRDKATQDRYRKAILKAAEKILAGKPNDEEMSLAVQAKMNMLQTPEQLQAFLATLRDGGRQKAARQVRGFILQQDLRKEMMAGGAGLKKPIEDAVAFLQESPPQVTDIGLAYMTGILSEMSGDKELATTTYAALAEAFAGSDEPKLAEFAGILEGVVRRLNLPGNPMKIEGKVLGKEAFDWSKYQGKVVLVDFWSSRNPQSAQNIASLKDIYKQYHQRGLEIVGITLDRILADVEKFVKTQEIPWPIVMGDDKINPTVVYYGVMSLPTTILVGKDGKVVSINSPADALASELDKLLGTEEKNDASKPGDSSK